MAFEGLDYGDHHFLKVWVQEIRLLLETVYLRKDTGIFSVNPTLKDVLSPTVDSIRCNRNNSNLASSSEGSPFKSRARKERRLSRNHSRLSNLVRIAR